MRNDRQKGSVTLETSIVLPLFILFFMFIYGLFSVVSTQNHMTHALVQASKSLSLDPYITENVASAAEEGTKFWGGLGDMVLDFIRLDNDPYFASSSDWYSTGNTTVVKNRFIGYLGGDKAGAEEKLKGMKIVDGLNGVTFTTVVDGNDITITMKYQIQYWFDFFGMGKIPMEQSIKTRLWKK